MAYGAAPAGLTPSQQPVGDTGCHEPRRVDAIVDADLQRALADPDPLRGIPQLTAWWAAAFVLEPAGVTRTKALGSERLDRKLPDALPGGDGALRSAVWEFMRPVLSLALVALNRDAFVTDEGIKTTVVLDGHRAASTLTNSSSTTSRTPRLHSHSYALSSRLGEQAPGGRSAVQCGLRVPPFCGAGRSSTSGKPRR